MKTMYPSCYHHNDVMVTHALGPHTLCAQVHELPQGIKLLWWKLRGHIVFMIAYIYIYIYHSTVINSTSYAIILGAVTISNYLKDAVI